MARLPHPGGDEGDWGTLLNDFLTQSHNVDGTLKDNIVTPAKLSQPIPAKFNPVAGTNVTLTGAYPDITFNATISAANLPAGSVLIVNKSGGTWPARPTNRTDITVQWKGPDPSPPIVPSGTGGMLDNIDIRFITP